MSWYEFMALLNKWAPFDVTGDISVLMNYYWISDNWATPKIFFLDHPKELQNVASIFGLSSEALLRILDKEDLE
jgi:hypothetical protein